MTSIHGASGVGEVERTIPTLSCVSIDLQMVSAIGLDSCDLIFVCTFSPYFRLLSVIVFNDVAETTTQVT